MARKEKHPDQALRSRLDMIIACFILTSLGLINGAAALVVYLLVVPFGTPAGPGIQTWFSISILAAIVFGIIADLLLFTSKLLVYRLFRRLNQPPK